MPASLRVTREPCLSQLIYLVAVPSLRDFLQLSDWSESTASLIHPLNLSVAMYLLPSRIPTQVMPGLRRPKGLAQNLTLSILSSNLTLHSN